MTAKRRAESVSRIEVLLAMLQPRQRADEMTAHAAFRRLRIGALAAGLSLTLAGRETFDLTNIIPDSKKKYVRASGVRFSRRRDRLAQGSAARTHEGL